ncbi:MauE/DoxX family redox-associated membrane protein [Tenacibaculum piscium]|uniref:MauE/DoxX family redox-associated membrane protein n=1 Tax=Tenacibaculum piscium TaxID=1458515 RepID=UPI001F3F59FA|nr:MauE/DoxX family redox-associated membrane protein [Tenacibaculum piscium]MCG8183444.1 DoxX family membrane protein [Tenacibaculum piscium]MCG8205069.1 DoxX family membrane protein [Tenacibaculum piscium]
MILKIITHISRILVGFLFIYSGFVKLVDPIGSQYKFEEYFSEDVLNLEFLIPFALPFSILLIVIELILGVMLLVGYKPKLTVWSLFGINLVFLFLTWYSYTYNKVTDCGCFGDALKLTPKETFYKNIVFMVFIGILILGLRYIKPLFSNKIGLMTTYTALLVSFGIVYQVLEHLPIIDFRAYAVGTDIAQGMKYQEGGDNIPPIHDFMIETDEGDLLETMLSKEKAMLIIMSNFDKSEKEGIVAVSEIANTANAKGYEIYVLTASYIEDLALTQKEFNMPYTFGFCDETALKTVIRANPGIVTVEKGIIVGKWNWTDAEDVTLK